MTASLNFQGNERRKNQWNFALASQGIATRLHQAPLNAELKFRPETFANLVGPDSRLRWRGFFEALERKGIIVRTDSKSKSVFSYQKTRPFPMQQFQENYGTISSHTKLSTRTDANLALEFPPTPIEAIRSAEVSLRYNYFLSRFIGVRESSAPVTEVLTNDRILQVIRMEQERERSIGSDRPHLSGEFRAVGKSREREFGPFFGARAFLCSRENAKADGPHKGKILLVAGDLVLERPALAFRNQYRQVYVFEPGNSQLQNIEFFSFFAIQKLPGLSRLPLFRTMSVQEAWAWVSGDPQKIFEVSQHSQNRTRGKHYSWGHFEPRIHFSMGRIGWEAPDPHKRILAFDVPKNVLLGLVNEQQADVGVGVDYSRKKTRDEGHQIELSIKTSHAHILAPFRMF